MQIYTERVSTVKFSLSILPIISSSSRFKSNSVLIDIHSVNYEFQYLYFKNIGNLVILTCHQIIMTDMSLRSLAKEFWLTVMPSSRIFDLCCSMNTNTWHAISPSNLWLHIYGHLRRCHYKIVILSYFHCVQCFQLQKEKQTWLTLSNEYQKPATGFSSKLIISLINLIKNQILLRNWLFPSTEELEK